MSDEEQQHEEGGGSTKLVMIVVAVVVAIIGAFGALVVVVTVIVASVVGESESSQGGANRPVCIPGEGDAGESGIEIPSQYQEDVAAAAQISGFSEGVVAAQIYHESSWDPQAESGVGAKGIAQFMPATWQEYGDGGDIWDPADAIRAQGRYLEDIRSSMAPHADSQEQLLELTLAGYNAGPGAVAGYDYDLQRMYAAKPGYDNETKPYVANIKTAASGDYTSSCTHASSDVPEGDIVDASMHLAWDERIELSFSRTGNHGREAAKPEYVEVADGLSKDRHTAYYTDCGVFVASVMRSSGVDPEYPARGTDAQLSYLRGSGEYEFFAPKSEGELQPGDILITSGHTFIYTGERNSSETGRAQGASLYTRPPSGHHTYITDGVNGTYYVARHKE